MRSAIPIEWQASASRWQSWVLLGAIALGLTALLFWTQWSPIWVGTALGLAIGLEAWRFRRSRAQCNGRYLIQSDGFWRLPDSEMLWQLQAVSWFPGICQCELVGATESTKKRRVLIWRDQVDAETWRRLRVRLS